MWYKVLKVSKNASRRRIEKAYQKLINDPKISHDMEKSLEIRQAYSEAIKQFGSEEYNTQETEASTISFTEEVEEFTDYIESKTKDSNREIKLTWTRGKSYLVAGIAVMYVLYLVINIGLSIASNVFETDDAVDEFYVEEPTTDIATIDEEYLDELIEEIENEEKEYEPATLSMCLMRDKPSGFEYDYEYLKEEIEAKGYTITDASYEGRKYIEYNHNSYDYSIYEANDKIDHQELLLAVYEQDEFTYVFIYNEERHGCSLTSYNSIDTTLDGESIFFVRSADINYEFEVHILYKFVSQITKERVTSVGAGTLDSDYTNAEDLLTFKTFYTADEFYDDIDSDFVVKQAEAINQQFSYLRGLSGGS